MVGTPQVVLRRPNRSLSLRKRYVGGYFLSSNDQVYLRALKKFIAKLALMRLGLSVDIATQRRMLALEMVAMRRYNFLLLGNPSRLPSLYSRGRKLCSFDASEVGYFFKHTREDFLRLFKLLRFNDSCVLGNRSRMSGEEVFLRGYFELRNGCDQFMIAGIFGGHQCLQSLAFSFFIDHMYFTWSDLVLDNLEWWFRSGWMNRSRDAISKMMAERFQLVYADCRDQPIAAFIDCNCLRSSRVLHCAVAPGERQQRWEAAVAEAFYNGWKSMYGLKHQTVDNVFGMTVHAYGPQSLRRNDNHLLSGSFIIQRMVDIQYTLYKERNPGTEVSLEDFSDNQEFNIEKVGIFGDSAYFFQSGVLFTYYKQRKNEYLDEQKKRENRARKTVRESIEWNYGSTAAKYQYLTNLKKLKVMQGDKVLKVYTVALLLKNFHACLYGNETSNFFDAKPPTLEQYILQSYE